jgi:hypothetical protein
MSSKIIEITDVAYFDGCYTFESGITGLNIGDIARRLGLPRDRISKGVDIYYALTVPSFDDFYWAGMALDSTDKFVDYPQGKPPEYNIKKFAELFSSSGITIGNADINALKQQWHNLMGIQKLVKVVPKVRHNDKMFYPAGSPVTPQFILKTKLQCILGASIPPNGNFRI